MPYPEAALGNPFAAFAFTVLAFANPKAAIGLAIVANELAVATNWLAKAAKGLTKLAKGLAKASFRSGVGLKYGKDSNEYEKAGGVRTSERKKPVRTPAANKPA